MASRNGDHGQGAWERRTRAEIRREQAAAARAAQDRHVEAQRATALAYTAAAADRVDELTGVLAGTLARGAQPLDFEIFKKEPQLGADARPIPAPEWVQYAPSEPGAVSRALGGTRRHEVRLAEARQRFELDNARWRDAEERRQQKVAAARAEATGQWAEVDAYRQRVLDGERLAVSQYYELILGAAVTPADLPTERRAAYVPESKLLVIEWDLPSVGVIPTEKEFQYIKTRDSIELRKSRSATEIRSAYRSMIAQFALQALYVAFRSDPGGLVETVGFNGMINETDRATGQPIRPCLLTLRATRDLFNEVDLRNVDPVVCIQRHFAASVTPHPEETVGVEPLLRFDMADPRIVDPVDVLSTIDQRPNLMDLTPTEFENFVQNLFDRMGFDTKLFQEHADGGIDCIAYDPTPLRGGKYAIQVKQYTKTVPPTAVRDLYGTMLNEGASKGILITTSGFGPQSHAFANNKPIELYDGTNLIALCQQHEVPARIVMPPKSRDRRNRAT